MDGKTLIQIVVICCIYLSFLELLMKVQNTVQNYAKARQNAL